MPVMSEDWDLLVWAADLLRAPRQDLAMPHSAAVASVVGVAVQASVARQLRLAVARGCLESSAAGQVAHLVVADLLVGLACYPADPCNLAAVGMLRDYSFVAAAVVAVAAAETVVAVAFS